MLDTMTCMQGSRRASAVLSERIRFMCEWVIGVDVGGTLRDVSAQLLSTGRTYLHKRPPTPHDPSEAILKGLQELKDKAAIAGEGIERFSHGTTVATNALLQRRG